MVKVCIALLAALAAVSMPASATVLAVGHGSGDSPEAARAAARDDLALRLQRRAEVRLEGARGNAAASVKRAIAGGRELPLIGVKLASVGAKRGGERYEARLTDASLTAYRSEAGRLARRLRAFDPVRLPGSQRTAEEIAEWLAHFDQHQRISAVLISLSPSPDGQLDLDEAKLWSVAVKTLSPVGGAKDVAQVVKRDLDRAGIAGVRVIAPVRANSLGVTSLAASIADEIRG